MTRTQLETGVALSRALLPEPPEFWSYSTLKAIGECPLRYALERSTYPDLWDRHGYPVLPNPAALFGNVVHGALETVVKALADAGVDSPQTVEATDVLRKLGGLTVVIEDAAAEQLAPLTDNPRLDEGQRRRFARGLRDQTPDLRVQVQTYLSRTRFVPGILRSRSGGAGVGSGSTIPKARPALGEGSHAEAQLVADDLRMYGRIDLLTVAGTNVEILDYKTGAKSAAYRDQLHLYALLWGADRQSNPERLPVSTLTAAYRDEDVGVAAPSAEELIELAAVLRAEVATADAELLSGVPRPVPTVSNCQRCSVRQLCAAYWQDFAPKFSEIADGAWFDYQGMVGEQHGPHSWWLIDETSGKPALLLRTSLSRQPIAEGDRLRFLGLRRESDPERDVPIASLTVTTEVFQLVTS